MMPPIGRWTGLVAGLLVAAAAWAQDQAAPRREAPPKPAFRFFAKPVDLWQTGRGLDEESRAVSSPDAPAKLPTSDWGQVVRTPSGELVYRELPAPLVAVLEDPTPENVRAFFEWRLGKARKILRAAEMIKQHRPSVSSDPETSDSAPKSAPPEAAPEHPGGSKANVQGTVRDETHIELIYFHKKGCPPCAAQDTVLEGWLKARPGTALEVVEFGTKPELWREHRVRGTPSLLVRNPKTGRSAFMEGLADQKRLDDAIFRLSPPQVDRSREGAAK